MIVGRDKKDLELNSWTIAGQPPKDLFTKIDGILSYESGWPFVSQQAITRIPCGEINPAEDKFQRRSPVGKRSLWLWNQGRHHSFEKSWGCTWLQFDRFLVKGLDMRWDDTLGAKNISRARCLLSLFIFLPLNSSGSTTTDDFFIVRLIPKRWRYLHLHEWWGKQTHTPRQWLASFNAWVYIPFLLTLETNDVGVIKRIDRGSMTLMKNQ